MYLEAIYDFPLGKETQLLQCVEIFQNIFSGYSLADPIGNSLHSEQTDDGSPSFFPHVLLSGAIKAQGCTV